MVSKRKEIKKDPAKKRPGNHFPIVGMGASAGGLKAAERFFKNLPPDSGLAFILVSHMDPRHVSLMPGLLQKSARIEVSQIRDGTKVRPNCVYVIPPGKDLAILQGTLQLMEPEKNHGLRLPINSFFCSLAQDQGKNAVCIIFSGTGTDGSLGLKAIHREGGMAMVQEVKSAEYDGMPESAIATGLADYILPPEKMPEKLIEYVSHPAYRIAQDVIPRQMEIKDALQKIFILIRKETGHDFSSYKKSTICRRIERRMNLHQIKSMTNYVCYLEQNPLEVRVLFKDILIGVTSFFRDPEAYEVLKQKIIPLLFNDKPGAYTLRAWVPGCSTGEEAYSLAIILQEYLEEVNQLFQIQIFGTDIDEEAIETARTGFYPAGISSEMSPDRLRRFFIKENNGFRIKNVIREMLIFAPQNILKDPSFTKQDLISCRNLFIYLEPQSQKKLISLFHYSLNPEGFLFVGSSETTGRFADLFKVVDKRWKLYKCRKSFSSSRASLNFSLGSRLNTAMEAPSMDKIHRKQKPSASQIVEKILLDKYAPPSVIIDAKGNVFYIHGRTGKYLEPAPGEARMNILEMARPGLEFDLASAIRTAASQEQEVVYNNLRVKSDGGERLVNLKVSPVTEPETIKGFLIVVFEDACPPKRKKSDYSKVDSTSLENRRIKELEQELKRREDVLQATIEEMQSSSEESQSVNEELETSKEELQSLNEELVTVNNELQGRIDELSKANDDIRNLLDSTEIATVFLDKDLRIKRFTPTTTEIIHLIPSDIGRPLGHLAFNLKYETLLEDARRVVETINPMEGEVQTKDMRWFFMRIIPYRTITNIVEGVVMTFVEISERKRAEEQLRKLSQAVEQSPCSIMITDASNNHIEYVNPKFCQLTGYSPEEVSGENPKILKSGEQPPEFYKQLWKTITSGDTWKGEFHNIKKNGELYWESASISPIINNEGVITHYVAVKEDITERKRVEKELRKAHAELKQREQECAEELKDIKAQLNEG